MSTTPPRNSVIEGARHIVATYLQALPIFATGQVIEHMSANTEAKLAEALGKFSLVVIVGIVSALEANSQSQTIFWEKVEIFVHVVENSLNILIEQAAGDSTPLPGAWAYAEEIISAIKLATLSDNLFPQLAEEPVQELPAADENSIIVAIKLRLRCDGNSTTN